MKAWEVSDPDDDEGRSAVVFAETRNKARVAAMSTDACEYAQYARIRATRFPEMDKFYQPGMTELDWNDADARIALVKSGWTCVDPNEEACKTCPAKEYCEVWMCRQEEEKWGRNQKSTL